MKTKNYETSDRLPEGSAQPAIRALESAGITWLSQCSGMSDDALRRLHGMGPRAIGLIRDALRAKGMTFAK
jgi:hypothetical protein